MTRALLLRPSLCLAVLVALLLPGAYVGTADAGGTTLVDLTVAVGDGLGGDGVGNYIDGDNCDITCVRARFISNDKTLSFDTRGTTRHVTLTGVCVSGCAGPLNVGAIEGLLEVLANSPFTRMAEGQSVSVPAKFWFTDADSVNWRVDWIGVRVVRVSSTQWQFIADDTDGSQVAGLSRLESSKRAKPNAVLSGTFAIPFSIVANQ